MKELYKDFKDHKSQHMQDFVVSSYRHCYKQEARRVIGDDIDDIKKKHKDKVPCLVGDANSGKTSLFFSNPGPCTPRKRCHSD